MYLSYFTNTSSSSKINIITSETKLLPISDISPCFYDFLYLKSYYHLGGFIIYRDDSENILVSQMFGFLIWRVFLPTLFFCHMNLHSSNFEKKNVSTLRPHSVMILYLPICKILARMQSNKNSYIIRERMK